jgi:hypothetical protein
MQNTSTVETRISVQHPILSDEAAKDIILRYHQQRSMLRQAVEICAKNREFIPGIIVDAIHCILTDSLPPQTLSSRDDKVSAATVASDLHTSTLQQHRESLGTVLRVRLTSASTNADVEGTSTELTPRKHVSMSQHAVLHHPNHPATRLREQSAASEELQFSAQGIVSPPKLTANGRAPRQLLQQAFEAKTNGHRRKEIEILVDFLRSGQEGVIPLDTSLTLRILRQLGEAHMPLEEYAAAEQYLFDWYLISDKVGDYAESSRALMMLGSAAHARGDLKAAQDWLSKARSRSSR